MGGVARRGKGHDARAGDSLRARGRRRRGLILFPHQRSAASEPTTLEPAILSGIYLFRGLVSEELEQLASLLQERYFPAGARVITADQSGEVIYVIRFVSAKVRTTRPDVTEVILAVLGPGKMVGE